MSTAQPNIPFESLLAHQQFVRALARNLVRETASADDVAQETWLSALTSPPRDANSVRGWLATVVRSRADNLRRERTRRFAREHQAARSEVDDSDEARRARVELSQDVVTAVLALDEPYRSVILQRYYEALETAEIAQRRGATAATVRSQLSRGHELLREKLDRRYGTRAAWSVALLPLVERGLTRSTKLALTLVVVLAIVSPLVWFAATRRAESTSIAALTPAAMAKQTTALEPASPPTESVRTTIASKTSNEQSVVDSAPISTSSIDLSALSARELVVLMVQTQRLLEQRVLVDSADWPDALAALAKDSDAGKFWIEPRGRFGFESSNPFGMRGGGAYYSFVTRSHSFDRDPDIELSAGGVFDAGVTAPGFLMSLGKLDLRQVPESATGFVDAWSPSMREAWTALWADSKYAEERAKSLGLNNTARAVVGETYVVRRLSNHDHDVLAAFTVLQERDHALRIAFRTLKQWPVLDQHGEIDGTAYDSSIGPAPKHVEELSVEQLFALVDRIRDRAALVLLAIDEPLRARFESLMSATNSGVVRVLERGRFDRVIAARGGGSCWSFATREHDYDREPDLELQGGMLSSGFYGGSIGMVLDLGELRLADVPAQHGAQSAGLDARTREGCEFMWSERPHRWNRQGQIINALDEEQIARADGLELRRGKPALVGHTYLVRSVMPDEHDLIAAFEVIQRDENGITIAWRVLETFPVPR